MESGDEQIIDSGVSLITADRVLSPPYGDAAADNDDTVDLYDDLMLEENDNLQQEGSQNHTGQNNSLNIAGDQGYEIPSASANEVSMPVSSEQTSEALKLKVPVARESCSPDLLDDCLLKQLNREESIKKLMSEIKHLQRENEKVQSQALILQKNMALLWKTARTQLKEKDGKIEELHRKYESLVFKRSMRSIGESDLDRLMKSISSYTPVRMHQFLQELRNERVNKKRCASPLRTSRTPSDVKSAVRGTVLSGNEVNVLLPLLPSQQQRLVSGVSALCRDGPDSISKRETTKDVWNDAVTARKGARERPLPKNLGHSERFCNQRSAKRVQISRTTRLIKQARNVLKRRRCSVTLSPRKGGEVTDVINSDATTSADATVSFINEAPCSIVSSSQIEASNRQTEILDDREGKQRDTDRITRHLSKVDLLTNTNLHMNKISEASASDRLSGTVLVSDETEKIPEKIMHSASERQKVNSREHHHHRHQEIGVGNSPGKRKSTRQTQIGNRSHGLANSRSSKENNKPDCNKKYHDKGSSIERLSPVSKNKSRPSRSFSPNQIVHSRSRSHSEEKHRGLPSRQCSPSLRFGSHRETFFHGGRPFDRKIKDFRPYQRRRTDSKPLRLSPRSRVSRNAHLERDDGYHGRRKIYYTESRNHRNRGSARQTRDNRSLSSLNPRSTRQSVMQSKEQKETSRRSSRRKKRVRSMDKEQDLQHVVVDSTVDPKVGEEHVDVQVRWQNESSRCKPVVSTLVDAHDTERLALERARLLAELKVIEELEAPSSPLHSENLAVSDNQLGIQKTKNACEDSKFPGPSAHNANERKRASNTEQNVTCDILNSEGSAKVVDIVGTSCAARAITSSRCPRAVDESRASEQQKYNTVKLTNQNEEDSNVPTVLPNAKLDAHAKVSSVIQVAPGDELDNAIRKGQKCSRYGEEKIQNSSRIMLKHENTPLISRPRFINMDDTIDKIVKNYNENNPSLSPVPSETSLLHFLERSRNEPEFSAVTFKNALDLSNCDIDGDAKADCCEGQPLAFSDRAAAGAAPDCGSWELAPQPPTAGIACNKSDRVSPRNANVHDLYLKNIRQIRRIHPTRVLPGTHTTASALLKSQIVELVPVKEYTLKPKLRLPTSSTEVISSNRLSFESSSRSSKKSTEKSAGVGKSRDVSDDERDIGNSDSSHSATDMSEVSKDSFIAKTSDEEILTNSKNTLDLTFLNLDLSLSVDSNGSATSRCKIDVNRVSPQKVDATSSTADQWAESPAKNTRSQKHLSQKLTRRGVKAVSLIGKKLPRKSLSPKIRPLEETRTSQPLSRNNSESNSSSLRVPVSCDKNAVGSLSCSNSHGSSSLSSTSSSSSSSSSSTNNSSASSSGLRSASNSSLNDPNAANRSERRAANCEKNAADFGYLNLSEAGGEVTVEKGREGNESPLRSAAVREKFKALFACDSNDEGSSEQKKDFEQSLRDVDGNLFVSHVPRHVIDCHDSPPASSPQSLLSSKCFGDSSSTREHDVYGENQRIQKRLKLTKKGKRKLSVNLLNSSKVISIVFNEESSTLCDGARTVNGSTCMDMPNKNTSSDINTANSHQVMGMDFLKTGKSLQTVHHSSISTPTLMKVRKRILTTPDTIGSRIFRSKKPVSDEKPTPKSNFDQGCAKGKTTPVMSVVSHSFESLPMPTSSISSSVVSVPIVQSATPIVHLSEECTVTPPLSSVRVAKPSLSPTMVGTASSDSVTSCSSALSSTSILLSSCLIASSNIKPSTGAEPRAYLPVAQSTVSSTEFGNSLLESDHATTVVEEPRCIQPPVGVLPRLPSCSEEGISSSLPTKTALTSLTSVSAHITSGQTMSTVPTFPVCQQSTESPTSNVKTASVVSPTPVSVVNAGHMNMKRDYSASNPTRTQTGYSPVSTKSTENEAESHISAKLETCKFSKVVNFSRKRKKVVKLSHSS